MGRKKLAIRRLESIKARQTKYSKRKVGIMKKAEELSVLCDVELALVTFSPSGKPSLYVGQNKDLFSVVERLSKISIESCEERRRYTLKLLRKIYNNTEVDPRNFSVDRSDFLRLQQDRFKELKEKLAHRTKILNEWKNPDTITDIAKLRLMQDHVIASLNSILVKKRQLMTQEQQRIHLNSQPFLEQELPNGQAQAFQVPPQQQLLNGQVQAFQVPPQQQQQQHNDLAFDYEENENLFM